MSVDKDLLWQEEEYMKQFFSSEELQAMQLCDEIMAEDDLSAIADLEDKEGFGACLTTNKNVIFGDL